MRAFALFGLLLVSTGCRDRLLDLRDVDLGADLRTRAGAELGLQVFASETITFGPGGGPNSIGTQLLAVVGVTKNPHPGTPVTIDFVSGSLRVNAGAQSADVDLMPDQQMSFRGVVPSVMRCPSLCDGPFSKTIPDEFRVELTFAVDGEEQTLVDAGVDLVCACQESF